MDRINERPNQIRQENDLYNLRNLEPSNFVPIQDSYISFDRKMENIYDRIFRTIYPNRDTFYTVTDNLITEFNQVIHEKEVRSIDVEHSLKKYPALAFVLNKDSKWYDGAIRIAANHYDISRSEARKIRVVAQHIPVRGTPYIAALFGLNGGTDKIRGYLRKIVDEMKYKYQPNN